MSKFENYDFDYLDEVEVDNTPQYTGPIVKQNYGPLTKGGRASIIGESKDWKLVKHNGRVLYVPKWVVG
jgi:hypothetical protein